MRAAIIALLALLPAQEEKEKPKSGAIDIVFCIDCSGSMGGIIETAKQKIWLMVNEIAQVRPAPRLRIGFVGYGNADRTHRTFELTDDLDKAYENLVTFKDEGWGSEWVGLAVKKATEEMKWAEERGALKIIFVAGNETARQGAPDYAQSAPAAIARGIMINALYCGTPSGEEEQTWRELASLADGQYQAIDPQGGAVTIETPFDKQLAELTRQVNATYVPYGEKGKDSLERQQKQDENAEDHGGTSNLAERACAKNWSGYDCRSWDLVDACRTKDFKWENVKKETLPKEIQKLSLEELKKHVAAKSNEREAIQKKVAELSKKRTEHVNEEMKKLGDDRTRAFDENVRKMIRGQAESKNFKFE